MIALFLALQALAAVPATPLGAIGTQSLPAKGCAAFLWSTGGDRQLVAMAVADPAQLRMSIDGRTTDIARTETTGPGPMGFGVTNRYRGGDVSATLEMTIVVKENLTQGAQVPGGTLTVERSGQDTVVLPVAGLIGCRA